MLKVLFLLLLAQFIGIEGCADFLIFLNSGQIQRNAEATRELALSLSNQLELDNRVHRVAISMGTDPENEVIDFDKIKTNADFNRTIREWIPEQLTVASKGLERRLEHSLRQAIVQRRLNIAIVVVIIDDDGTSAFMTNPTNFGIFSEFVQKRHYIYTLIVSRKAERIRTTLDFDESSVDTAANKDELRLIASPFTKCQIRSANELRRKPLPRISSSATASPVLATKSILNNQQSLIVTSRFITVPVSVRFPTIKVSTTPQTTTVSTTQSPSISVTTTSKPKKPGCQFDIVILFDLSGNSQENLQKYQNLTKQLIEQSEIGSHASRFALIRYSGRGRSDTAFHLNKHSNKTLLLNEIDKILPMGGVTRTKEAMLHGLREFDTKFGARPRNEVQRVMIVFTDGYSQDDPTDAAQPLAHELVHVYSVSIENPNLTPDYEQLKSIASDAKSALLGSQFGTLVDQLAPQKCRL